MYVYIVVPEAKRQKRQRQTDPRAIHLFATQLAVRPRLPHTDSGQSIERLITTTTATTVIYTSPRDISTRTPTPHSPHLGQHPISHHHRPATLPSHSLQILNPGLLAVAEQSAAHHGLLVHAQEAKACALCILISALHSPSRRRHFRRRDLRGPSARILVTITAERRANAK